MSDFLNELRSNAQTEKEYERQRAKEEQDSQKRYEEEKRQKELKKELKLAAEFEKFMERFFKEVKETCIDAVKQGCYVEYNGKRYLLCSVALMYSYENDMDSGPHKYRCWMEFECFKLNKSGFFSKKSFTDVGKIKYFDYVKITDLAEDDFYRRNYYRNPQRYSDDGVYLKPELVSPYDIGCHTTGRMKADFMDLGAFAKKYLDGYTDINKLPKQTVKRNMPVSPFDREYNKYGYNKNVVCSADFAIEF